MSSKVFSSGVVKEYAVDYVEVLTNVEIKVTPRDKAYVVEAAVALALLGLKPAADLTLRGDFGATHGDAAGQRFGQRRLAGALGAEHGDQQRRFSHRASGAARRASRYQAPPGAPADPRQHGK